MKLSQTPMHRVHQFVSVTRIVPISAVIIAPTFPAKRSPKYSGTSSSIKDLLQMKPTTLLGSNRKVDKRLHLRSPFR